jgi:indole-3-glycerol phosphate synthase
MMLRTSSGILAEIVDQKKLELAELRPRADELERTGRDRPLRPRGFAAALRGKNPAIIAEIKKASPSKGVLQPNFRPAAIAEAYEAGGAACVSVLTDRSFFQGSLGDLENARAAVSLPVIRKDFTIDALQIFEAAAHGADAILLIAAILTTGQLQAFRELAGELGMAALVEVHDGEELKKAVDSGAEIIGVNNRNLDTFEVSLDTSVRLSARMPASVTRVSESGIFSNADVQKLQAAGFHAFLVGESLMKAADPAHALKALCSPLS